MADLAIGTVENGYRFVGGDPGSATSWEPEGLSIGTVDSGYRFKGGDPSLQDNWEEDKAPKGLMERFTDEAARLRDELFSGVDSARAAIKTDNTAMMSSRLQNTAKRLQELEARGEGDSITARQMRGELQSVQGRLPAIVGEMTEAQSDAQRGSQMATRPAVSKLNAAKTWGEAWDAFKEAPYDVIAGVTAQSLPATLPGLVAAAAMGPGAGALVMGANSAAVEAGSSLGDYAREQGVDTTNPQAVQAFFADRDNLAAAMSYAGKRAGIIGGLDALSGGVAGKTLAPQVKSRLARQAVNMPAQMGVQAGLGAGGEAGAQLATKGTIDQPGQVVAEAVGELGGAPAEVVAFSKDARDAFKSRATAADVLAAPDADSAIAAATEAVSAPILQAGRQWQDIAPTEPLADLSSQRAASEAGQVWQDIQARQQRESEEAGAAASRATDERIAAVGQQWQDLGITDPQTDLQRQKTWGTADASQPVGTAAEPASSDAGRGPDTDGGARTGSGVADGAGGNPPVAGAPVPGRAEAVAVGDAAQPAALNTGTPTVSRNPSGTLTIRGDAGQIVPALRSAGVTQFMPAAGGVTVSVTQADRAQRAIADFRPRTPARASAPTSIWFGRAGDGYASPQDAQNALPSRQRIAPELSWRIEAMPSGKYRLAGYESAPATVAPKNKVEPSSTLLPEQSARVEPSSTLAPAMALPRSLAQRAAVAPTASAAPVIESLGRTGSPGPAGGRNARGAAYEANPFKAFLGKHGISSALTREFAPGQTERRAAMVRGYGPVFRKSGKQLDLLAQAAVEDGFLQTPDVAQLESLIHAVLRGERITARFAPGAVEQEMQGRIDRQRALEEDAASDVAALPDEALFDIEESDDDIPWGAIASNATRAQAMRALGFTEQEIAEDEAAERTREPQAAGQGTDQPVQAAGRQAQADRAGGNEEARADAEGLTAPTEADILSQQDRARAGERAEAARKADEEKTAKAEAERKEIAARSEGAAATFELGQSAEDNLRGQAPMFRRSESTIAPGKLTQIDEAVSRLTRDWLRKPDIHVLGTMDDAPEPVRRVWQQQNSQGAVGAIEGFHWRGGVYLVAEALATKGDVQRVLFHEALGHFGLRGVWGSALDGVLKETAAALPKEMRAKASQYGFDLADPRQRLQAAEEVLAEMAQSRPEMGIVKRAVAAIRTWLRAHGIDSLRMTKDEIIANFILPARGWVERAKDTRPDFARGTTEPMASRKDVVGEESDRPAGDKSPGTLADVVAAWDAAGIKNTLSEKNGTIELSRIEVPREQRNGGIGTKAMQQLIDYADATGQRITLTPSSDFGGSKTRLTVFYKRFGFVENKGRNKDFTTRDRMIREPQANESPAPNSDGAFSRAPRTIEVDGTRRPIENSAGQPIVANHDMGKLKNFWKWFGGSAVVDEQGRPIVMFHGTNKTQEGEAFTMFDTYASNYGLMGQGGYFTAEPLIASEYTKKGRGDTPTVYPAYLSIKNPIEMEAKADAEAWQKQFPDADAFHEGGDTNESWYRAAEESIRDQEVPMYEGAEIMQDGLRAMGFDGIKHIGGGRIDKSGEVRHRVYVAFDPEQVKSATGNTGTFDPENPDIRFSRSVVTNLPLPQTWQGPDESKLDDLIYSLQDKHIDTKRAVQAVRDSIGQIDDAQDPYLQEELFHGRAAMQTKEFLEKEIRPLLVDLQLRGVALSDFEEYLHNRHAEARNVQVAKVNPGMPDGGSGIKTADARRYLANLPAADRRAYVALARRVDAINKETRKLLIDSGLEKRTTIAAWEQAYGDEYVPLMREEMDNGTTGIGQGYSVKGSASKRAMGSNKPVADIIANIALQRERTITRANKRRIGEALYGLVLKAPNDDFWFAVDPDLQRNPAQVMATQMQLISMGLDPADAQSIAQEPKTRYIDAAGQVAERINPAMRSMDNVLAVRIDGEDKFVFFNAKDPRAMRMVTALKNLDADQLGTVMGNVAKVTRYFAAINTQWNPIFGVTNLTRDVQTALLNLNSTPLAKHKAEVMKHVLPALRGIYIDLRDHRAGKQPTSVYAAEFEEFQREGGATGYRDMYANAKERADAIASELKALKDGRLMALGKGIMGWLSDYNESMENAVRLSAYKVGKAQGLSNQQAASLAKNLTVNFNRKGQVALQAGALYAFFNASVQGSARMAQTMFEGGGLSKVGKKIVAGGLLLGTMQALLLAAAGYDDDEPPDFVRERSLVIPLPDKKYLSIPMPLGFHVIPNLARIPTEWAMGGFKNTPKRIAQLLGVFADAFNPIGSAGLSLQTIAPTVIDPLAALAENKDWTGKPIAKKDFNAMHPTAGHTRAKDTATPWAKLISWAANAATGGTDYKPGMVSPTPDQIDYLIGQVTGGVGREVGKAFQVTSGAISGEDVPLHKIPLVGRFVGTTEGQAAEASRFYDNLRQLGEHKVQIDGLKKDHKGRELVEYLSEHKEARLVPMAEKLYRDVAKLQEAKRNLVDKGAPRERVKLIEMQITRQMKLLNDRVRELEKQPSGTEARTG